MKRMLPLQPLNNHNQLKTMRKKEIATILFLLFSYTFSFAQPSNDNRTGAIEIAHTALFTSADAAYTNVNATQDGPAVGCIAPSRNVWFKFQATSTDIEVRVRTGGTKGTLQNPAVVLFTEQASLLGCHGHSSTAFLQRTNLVVGDWYYISVDAVNGEQGSFTVIAKNSIGHDLRERAITLQHTADWISADAEFTNIDSTPDGPGSACISPTRNVWFKFQATSTDIEVRVLTGGSKGTLQSPAVVLISEQGTVLGCHGHSSTAFLQRTNLVVGDWYYIAVDAVNGEQGSFSIITKNSIGHDLRERAITLQHSASWTSANAEFTNVNSTGDGPGAGCINPRRNVWFKFQATSTDIEVRVNTGGVKGTLQYPAVVLFTEQGDLLGCHGHSTTAFLQRTNLVVSNWYYVAVDAVNEDQGSFTLEIRNSIGHDLRERAITIQHTTSWTSIDAAYNNVNSTPDGPGAGCISLTRNVWFKFQATSTDIDVKVLRGDTKGTLQNPAVVLFTEQGSLLGCHGNSSTAFLQRTNLIVGNWYYIAVDAVNGEQGTFTLSIKNDLGYDYKTKAQILPHESEWCSADAFFTNAEATADETNSSTCGSTFTKNVWFKFQATSTAATAKLLTGGEKGTLANGSLYLTDANGNFLTCQTGAGGATVSITNNTLVKGQWYFIIVDNSNGTNGTFSLCLEGGVQTSTFCESIHCDSEGGVGIGTTTIPNGYRLAVQGKIIAEGVKVDLHTNWPDYVFDKDYPLMSLADMKQYIEREGHLPDVPSAKEVQANGIDLGEMNAILLRKIEENTLLLIELGERLRLMEIENQKLKSKKRNR